LPYRGRSSKDAITDIRAGKRPSRPTDPDQSRWLQDPVWDVITSGWHHQPEQRCQLSDMYNTFSLQRQHYLEWGIQRQVNEMNEVNFSTSHTPPKANTIYSVLRTARYRTRSEHSCSMSFAKHAAETVWFQHPCSSPTVQKAP